MKKRAAPRRRVEKKRTGLTQVKRWRALPDLPCDACGAPRTHHVPLCAEVDPVLVTFWVSLCDGCVLDRNQAISAYRNVRSRGWARGGPVLDDETLAPPLEHADHSGE
jgi:hypothetical protein